MPKRSPSLDRQVGLPILRYSVDLDWGIQYEDSETYNCSMIEMAGHHQCICIAFAQLEILRNK